MSNNFKEQWDTTLDEKCISPDNLANHNPLELIRELLRGNNLPISLEIKIIPKEQNPTTPLDRILESDLDTYFVSPFNLVIEIRDKIIPMNSKQSKSTIVIPLEAILHGEFLERCADEYTQLRNKPEPEDWLIQKLTSKVTEELQN